MNKALLIDQFSKAIDSTKAISEKIINVYIRTIQDSLEKGDEVKISGFGRWYVASRRARAGKNPQTGAVIQISAFKMPVFKPGKLLKNAIKP